MKNFRLTDLLIFVVTAELVGALSALLAGDFTSFYDEVIRPPLSPPAWLFPVVWAILYALMGTSAYMIWNNRKNELRRSSALKLYYIQLAVNFFSLCLCSCSSRGCDSFFPCWSNDTLIQKNISPCRKAEPPLSCMAGLCFISGSCHLLHQLSRR